GFPLCVPSILPSPPPFPAASPIPTKFRSLRRQCLSVLQPRLLSLPVAGQPAPLPCPRRQLLPLCGHSTFRRPTLDSHACRISCRPGCAIARCCVHPS